MRRKIALVLICLFLPMIIGTVTVNGAGAIYYVDSAAGNDACSGLSPEEAWKSLDMVNATVFRPGDSILFKRGGVWEGTLEPKGSGTASLPITIASYGEDSKDKPLIRGTGENAVVLMDVSYWNVTGLTVTNGDNTTEGLKRGVFVYAPYERGVMSGIKISDLEIYHIDGYSGGYNDEPVFGNAAIYCVAGGQFDGLVIENNYIHDVKTIGIYLASYQEHGIMSSENVVIRGNTIDRNGRDGIIVTNAVNPLIEYNRLYRIGANGRDLNWIAGIFPTKCQGGIIQHNEVAYIVPSDDSFAYDLDVNNTGTFYFQYNYSHDNAGGFYMQPGNALLGETDKCVVRYNISQNERGRFRIQSGNTYVYNNILYDSENAIEVGTSNTGGISNVFFYNNIFWSPQESSYWYEFIFDNNLYYGHTPPMLDRHSLASDPMFINGGSGGDGISTLSGYKLESLSPCIGAGLTIEDSGSFDFWGNLLHRTNVDIGAYESSTTSVNLVRNGGFDHYGSSWNLPPQFSVTDDGGGCVLRLDGLANWNAARQDVSVCPNTNYVLTFNAKGNCHSNVKILSTDIYESNVLGESGILTLGEDWKTFNISFFSDSHEAVRIFVGDGGTGTSFFDNFSIMQERTKKEPILPPVIPEPSLEPPPSDFVYDDTLFIEKFDVNSIMDLYGRWSVSNNGNQVSFVADEGQNVFSATMTNANPLGMEKTDFNITSDEFAMEISFKVMSFGRNINLLSYTDSGGGAYPGIRIANSRLYVASGLGFQDIGANIRNGQWYRVKLVIRQAGIVGVDKRSHDIYLMDGSGNLLALWADSEAGGEVMRSKSVCAISPLTVSAGGDLGVTVYESDFKVFSMKPELKSVKGVITIEGELVKCCVYIKNGTYYRETATILFGFYADGRLTGCKIYCCSLKPLSLDKFFVQTGLPEGTNVKVFIWNNLEQMIPLGEIIEGEIGDQ